MWELIKKLIYNYSCINNIVLELFFGWNLLFLDLGLGLNDNCGLNWDLVYLVDCCDLIDDFLWLNVIVGFVVLFDELFLDGGLLIDCGMFLDGGVLLDSDLLLNRDLIRLGDLLINRALLCCFLGLLCFCFF